MIYRVQKYNASANVTPVYKWKIQFKRGRLWRDYRNVQGVKIFDNPYHAENYKEMLSKPKTVSLP